MRPLLSKAGDKSAVLTRVALLIFSPNASKPVYFIMLLDDEKNLNPEQDQPAVENAAEEQVEQVTSEESTPVETPVVEASAPVVEDTPAEEPVAEASAPVVEDTPVETPVVETSAPVVEDTPLEAPVAEASAPVVENETEEEEEEEEEELDLPAFEPVIGHGAHDDFNWSMDKRGAIAYGDAERSSYLSQYDATLRNVNENEIIKGMVSAVTSGDVVLDINYKSDGVIPASEFRDMPDIKQGDIVEVYVESQEDRDGQLGLSRKKAKILRAWESIVDSFKNGTIIRGTIISKTKGGLIAEC